MRIIFVAGLLSLIGITVFMPSAAWAQNQSFVVYFGLDKSDLDQTALATIASAAQEFQRSGSASLSLRGHADTSGNADYNQALSERRRQAVEQELIRLGVPASAITADAVGETDLAVQTGDGVREAQNRRVEIQLAPPPPPPPAPAPEPQVAEAAPPPPAPAPRWLITPALFYGYNLEDEQSTHSHLIGINISGDYLVTDWMSIGLEQAGFYHFDTDDDGLGGRTMVGPDFYFGDPQDVAGYVGANIGGIYGDGFDDDFAGGPEVGLIVGPINWKIGYDIPFNRGLDEGIINTSIGAIFRF